MRTPATTIALIVSLTATGWAKRTPLSTPLERAGFEKIERRHGVTVYAHKESKALHFAGEARFAVPPRQVQQALLAYERQAGHIGRLSESRILQRRPKTLVVYQRLDMPVIDDRDYTLKVRWGREGEDLWVTFRALGRGPATRKGVVRVTRHGGSWQLRPVDGGRATFARYQMLMDLASWVPMWMARRSAGKEVVTVFVEFSRMMAADRKRGRAKTAWQPGSATPPGGADRTRAGSR